MRCAFLGHIYVGLSPAIPVKVVGFVVVFLRIAFCNDKVDTRSFGENCECTVFIFVQRGA